MPLEPSRYQRAIYQRIQTTEESIVVSATAGSGKTTTLVTCLNYVPSDKSVILLAFNKAMEQELQARVADRVETRTIHSAGLQIITSALGHTPVIDSTGKKYRSLARERFASSELAALYDEKEAKRAVTFITRLAHFFRVELVPVDGLYQLVGRYQLQGPNARSEIHQLMLMTLDVVEEGIRQGLEGFIDFEDMLFVPVIEDMKAPHCYDFVFVDEAQDLSRAQLLLVRKLLASGGRFVFVGDQSQSLYGFNGADMASMRRISALLRVEPMPLSISYRCPASHVRMAKRYGREIEAAPSAIEGEISVIKDSEFAKVVKEGDLVLSRMNAPLIKAALTVLASGQAVQVAGRGLLENLLEQVEAIFECDDDLEEWEARIRSYEESRITVIEKFGLGDDEVATWLVAFLDQLESLVSVIRNLQATAGLTLANIRSRLHELFDQEGAVYFSTVHRAKGREASRVFVYHPHLMPIYSPNSAHSQAETCVQFVALTRSKESLILVEKRGEASPKTAWWYQGWQRNSRENDGQ